MDTSETYIKMCDCEEIQGQWELEIGDFFCDDEEIQVVWYEGMESREQINRRREYYKNKMQPKWLPRQDQIQDMIGKDLLYKPHEESFVYDTVCDLYHLYGEAQFNTDMETWEQLWLAFYMHEKHSKIWDGEKWIKK